MTKQREKRSVHLGYTALGSAVFFYSKTKGCADDFTTPAPAFTNFEELVTHMRYALVLDDGYAMFFK